MTIETINITTLAIFLDLLNGPGTHCRRLGVNNG